MSVTFMFQGRPLPEEYKSDCWNDVDETEFACQVKTTLMKSREFAVSIHLIPSLWSCPPQNVSNLSCLRLQYTRTSIFVLSDPWEFLSFPVRAQIACICFCLRLKSFQCPHAFPSFPVWPYRISNYSCLKSISNIHSFLSVSLENFLHRLLAEFIKKHVINIPDIYFKHLQWFIVKDTVSPD